MVCVHVCVYVCGRWQILPGSTINLASRRNPHDSSDEQLIEFDSNERSFTIRDYSRRVRGTDRYWSLPTQFLRNKVHSSDYQRRRTQALWGGIHLGPDHCPSGSWGLKATAGLSYIYLHIALKYKRLQAYVKRPLILGQTFKLSTKASDSKNFKRPQIFTRPQIFCLEISGPKVVLVLFCKFLMYRAVRPCGFSLTSLMDDPVMDSSGSLENGSTSLGSIRDLGDEVPRSWWSSENYAVTYPVRKQSKMNFVQLSL